MPDSLLFLRETIGSSPGYVLFRSRAAYFRWKLSESRWKLCDLGGNHVILCVLRWKSGGCRWNFGEEIKWFEVDLRLKSCDFRWI